MNIFFGIQNEIVESAIRGFFEHLELPVSLETFSFYARFDNLALFRQVHESTVIFPNLSSLSDLKRIELSLIANTFYSHPSKEQDVELVLQFFTRVLSHSNDKVEEITLNAIKNTSTSLQKTHRDEELLSTIVNQFPELRVLSLEFPDNMVRLISPEKEIVLPQLERLLITGCELPLAFCSKISSEGLKELSYTAPKAIPFSHLIEYFEGVSNMTPLRYLSLFFPGFEKYDMSKEILEGIIKIFQRLEELTEFMIYIDVRTKTGTLGWLLDLANAKVSLRSCSFNFYHYGAAKPRLIVKEDFWLKHYLERNRKFLIK